MFVRRTFDRMCRNKPRVADGVAAREPDQSWALRNVGRSICRVGKACFLLNWGRRIKRECGKHRAMIRWPGLMLLRSSSSMDGHGDPSAKE